jgi:hypothetical protein
LLTPTTSCTAVLILLGSRNHWITYTFTCLKPKNFGSDP